MVDCGFRHATSAMDGQSRGPQRVDGRVGREALQATTIICRICGAVAHPTHGPAKYVPIAPVPR
jgi:hypothetical protein